MAVGWLGARFRSPRALASALRWRLCDRRLRLEARGRLATPDDVHFAYRLLLDREPDPGGFADWSARLGAMTPADLASEFMRSAEYRRRYIATLGHEMDFVKPPVVPPSWQPLVSQMVTQSQIDSTTYWRWCDEIAELPKYHRKQWEYVYLLQALDDAGMLRPGARGLGFGVGHEPVPSVLAKRGCEVLITDLEQRAAERSGWRASRQHAGSVDELHRPEICDREVFRERVRFRNQDMNAIDDDLRAAGFDFVWSLCALEHLGSLRDGLRFVEQSLACVKPGGIAVHTTEFNVSSNADTISHGATVLYRQRDIEGLAQELARQGHTLQLNFHPGDGPLDRYYDVPPYRSHVQLKIELQRFVATSLGLVIRKGTA